MYKIYKQLDDIIFCFNFLYHVELWKFHKLQFVLIINFILYGIRDNKYFEEVYKLLLRWLSTIKRWVVITFCQTFPH
jgi:hypothetical protein